MHITVARRDLAPVLAAASRVVERRNTIPILSHVLLAADAAAGTLAITATDLDVEYHRAIPAQVTAGGAVAVSARMLADIIAKLPDGPVTLQPEPGAADGSIRITSGRSRFRLSTLPPADMPVLAFGPASGSVAGVDGYRLPAADFAAGIAATAHAVSTEETRYYLCGILLEATAAGLVAVATDGHRLAAIDIIVDHADETATRVVVPSKTVHILAAMLKAAPQDADITLLTDGAKIRTTVAGTRLTSKLIDGTYPDWRRVVPAPGPSIALSRDALSLAVDRVMTVSSERGRAVRLDIDPAAGEARISASNPEAGTAEEFVALTSCDLSAGTAPVVGLNGRYLLDALAQMAGATVHIHPGDGGPVTLADPSLPALRQVIMPMRV